MDFRSDVEAMVLGVLQDQPGYGYEIAKRIRELSEDLFKYGEAQLYPALRKLEENGYVTAEWVVQEGKPNRRVYSITEDGSRFLRERQQEFEKFVDKVNAVMKPAKAWAVGHA
ncbi:MAG: PadR family transcriptional regulator [Armatimonadetes bacterium]|nr:PadR family transcriptional regulator [Armatimonadota bacterium]